MFLERRTSTSSACLQAGLRHLRRKAYQKNKYAVNTRENQTENLSVLLLVSCDVIPVSVLDETMFGRSRSTRHTGGSHSETKKHVMAARWQTLE